MTSLEPHLMDKATLICAGVLAASLPAGDFSPGSAGAALTLARPLVAHLVGVTLIVLALARLPCALHQPACCALAAIVTLLAPGVANLSTRSQRGVSVASSPDVCTPARPCISWCTPPCCNSPPLHSGSCSCCTRSSTCTAQPYTRLCPDLKNLSPTWCVYPFWSLHALLHTLLSHTTSPPYLHSHSLHSTFHRSPA